MKQVIIFTILIVNIDLLQAQWLCSEYMLTLEDTFCSNLRIDTSKQNNIWQIGSPQKNIFTDARSPQRVIVTDTLNSYPVNANSSFTIMNTAGIGFTWPFFVGLGGYYKVDTDSLNDYGLIEFSPDNGTTWIDLLHDTIYNSYYDWSSLGKPILTGKTTEWTRFLVRLGDLGPVFNIQDRDTVLYKFTFISDSIPDSLDGLMFDDFDYADFLMGIEGRDIQNIKSKLYPNPAYNNAIIEFDNAKRSPFILIVYDYSGKVVYEQKEILKTAVEFGTENLSNGIYCYELFNDQEKKRSVGKFIVEK